MLAEALPFALTLVQAPLILPPRRWRLVDRRLVVCARVTDSLLDKVMGWSRQEPGTADEVPFRDKPGTSAWVPSAAWPGLSCL